VQEIQFQLEPADVEAWYLYQLDSVKAYRYQYWATAVIVSGVCVVSADQWAGSTVISAAAAVAGFGAGWYGARASFRSYVRAVARERAQGPSSVTEFGAHRLSFDASGISESLLHSAASAMIARQSLCVTMPANFARLEKWGTVPGGLTCCGASTQPTRQ
jgi:hypothetical protein